MAERAREPKTWTEQIEDLAAAAKETVEGLQNLAWLHGPSCRCPYCTLRINLSDAVEEYERKRGQA